MFPTDIEFTTLYVIYFIGFVFTIYLILKSRRTNKIRLVLITASSLALNASLFYNPENFKYGGSLVILFYSVIIFLLTITAVTVNQLYPHIKRSNKHHRTDE
ncbi:hypothetical protein Pedsa_1288 [Pseudopedobacter saltans DSM 12145]|uniref:Uncharacterized protein n=1 Tax=Pseudopedobacter saltans (strain ATCC 51119 / DSM 12145 / JCM 21818 / CCUG 39354 / LMG 10337 / NBRC 100064 / NCIMB 13643) TaxID=762903 RepID=F0SDV9_PSESL|nr:hypothetical protein [Pseudopedobacter saltans]ADY51855.1 hypothetical protein Pedsa_1288 [Pseudopedobacter saltans DSM 12145]